MQVSTKAAVILLNYIKANASTEYGTVVPAATQANIAAVGNAISAYTATANEFLSTLINKIGKTVFTGVSFENPFQAFYKDSLEYGDTIEEIYTGLIAAENTPTIGAASDPFADFSPANIDTLYHKIDYDINFPLTVKDDKLKHAFLSAGALAEFIGALMSSMNTSRKYFDFVRTKKILSTDTNFGLVTKIEELNDYEVAAKLLFLLKSYANDMVYPKTIYNAKGVTMTTPKEQQIIVLRNDIKNVIDVEVLANIFNLDKTKIDETIIGIDNFTDGAQIAAMLDREALKVFATVNGEQESIRNPRGHYTNYFMNAVGGQSFSLFRNAVKFTFKQKI